jgi:hypothetical protein
MPTVIVHILNEDPIMGDVDKLPEENDSLLIINNPRKRDGKDLSYIDANVTKVIWPINRINFIEVIPTSEEEEIITFVRE